jgi:hypothetical protein
MLKMLAYHCHTSFGSKTHGLADGLKKMPGVLRIKEQLF